MGDDLAHQLDAFYAAFVERAEPAIAAAFERSQQALSESDVAERALQLGDRAPDFELPSQSGGLVALSTLLTAGPVVLTFFRGGWCPFCAMSLRALAKIRPQLRGLGAELVAIAPELPSAIRETAERYRLAFPVLSDHDNAVARRYGLAWALDADMRSAYEKLGHSLPTRNGTSSWELPIPASFVIAPNGRIVARHVDPLVQRRIEPAAALEAVRRLPSAAT